jgi:hypothetical protein
MNNIRATLQYITESLRNSPQVAMSTVLKLKDFRDNPEFFQKVCQVAHASLQLIMIRYSEAASLSRLSSVFVAANMHDFYSFLKQPRQWFCPISAETIDENKVLKSLTNVVSNQIDVKKLVENVRDDTLKSVLKAQLEEMAAHSDAYHSAEDFKRVLYAHLKKTETFVYLRFDLDELEICLRHTSLAERLKNVTWTLLDVGCIAFYFKEWKLLDTAKLAERIGQFRGLHWIKNQSLGTTLIGLVFTGFALKLFEAVRKLEDEALTQQEKNQARWDRVTSAAELVLWGSVYLNLIGRTKIDNVYIQCLAIFAKSLGLISIAMRPAHEFFQEP